MRPNTDIVEGTKMHRFFHTIKHTVATSCVGLAMLAGTAAQGADKVSGDFGLSYNTHFISYGADVWGGGGDFYGDNSTTFAQGSLTLKITDSLSVNTGAWADINNNTTSSIGGNLQEVDVWIGASYAIGPVTLGATYQSWNYAGDVEEIVDISLGLDDSKWMKKYALNPSVVWHYRASGNGSQKVGSAVVVSIKPGTKLTGDLSLDFPAGIGFFTTDDFQGGTDSGYGYSYIGASLGYPLKFIPSNYGTWSANFDLIAYFTNKDAIPGNPAASFVTGSVGLSLSF